MKHHQIIIIGGGNAGISVAAKLKNARKNLDIAIIEPSEKHYYQPAWTLVGGGDFNINDTVKPEKDFIPNGVTWIKDAVAAFEPENNQVKTKNGEIIGYDYLIVAPGIQLNWHLIEGLTETLGKNGVTSNYSFDLAPYTFEVLKSLKSGEVALFSNPGTPVKCGGAPQKIMYLVADYLRKHGLGKSTSVEYCSAGGVIFGIKKYADELLKMVGFYGIKLNFKHDLIKVDGPNQVATFKLTDAEGNVTMVEKKFNMLHVTPPQSAPDFIRMSPLAIPQSNGQLPTPCQDPSELPQGYLGWIDVNKETLQHSRYSNIFGLGDATNTPNAKTGAAVRKQAPVLVENLLSLLDSKPMPAKYNGYGSCPLIVGYGKLILAEFDYNNNPTETFPFDQSKPRWSMYFLKKHILPRLYWNQILKGKM